MFSLMIWGIAEKTELGGNRDRWIPKSLNTNIRIVITERFFQKFQTQSDERVVSRQKQAYCSGKEEGEKCFIPIFNLRTCFKDFVHTGRMFTSGVNLIKLLGSYLDA